MNTARRVFIGSGHYLAMALEQWRALLGPENVVLDPADLRAAETAT